MAEEDQVAESIEEMTIIDDSVSQKFISETPLLITSSLESFRLAIGDQPLYRKTQNDRFLLRFLRCAKFNIENSATLFNNYWRLYDSLCEFEGTYEVARRSTLTLRRKTPVNVTSPFESAKIIECLATGWLQLLPTRDLNDRQILLCYPKKFDPNTYTSSDVLAAILKVIDVALDDPATQKYGLMLVLDVTGSTPQNVNVNAFTKIVAILQKSVPVRIGNIQIIGLPTYLKTLWRMMQKVLSKKIKKRMHIIYSNDRDNIGHALEEYIAAESLPQYYNGYFNWDVESSMKKWVTEAYL